MRDLVYGTTTIRKQEEMVNLTDMWRAAGAIESRRPVFWQQTQLGAQFIEFVAANLKTQDPEVWRTKKGNAGGTYAHWQIALAYAKFLSHEFHAWCNTVVREHMEGRVLPAEPARVEPVQEEFQLQPPPSFSAEQFTVDHGRKGFAWTHDNMKTLQAEMRSGFEALATEVWHAKGSLLKGVYDPARLAARGLLLLPAPTPDTIFITSFEACKRVLPEDEIQSKLPIAVGKALSNHAKEHCWPQGLTPKRGMSSNRLNTYPESRVAEWLSAGGAALIERLNSRFKSDAAVSAGAIPLFDTNRSSPGAAS